MNCAEAEILIGDYLDGTLASARRAELEVHLNGCPGCAELAGDGRSALEFMERAADVEPPPELISRILFDPPWHKRPSGGWLRKAFHAALQPKLAMGMALTILSFAMIMPRVGRFTAADLQPTAVWGGIEDRFYRIWARTEKFYNNLKFIYQIQATLREWQQQTQETPTAPASRPQSRIEDRRVPIKTPPEAAPAGRTE
ncbi:MAG: zf-HC2 domain-containing protein [Acidobacteriia bacterium]|nr:zf-HC2 domain-containing protein [Terriglobia bacterium]